jgi:hypothetical protein
MQSYLRMWSFGIEEVDYHRVLVATFVRNLADLLFVADCLGFGSGGFGAKAGLLSDTRRLFRTMLNALRSRGKSKNSLNTARKTKQASGSSLPHVVSKCA